MFVCLQIDKNKKWIFDPKEWEETVIVQIFIVVFKCLFVLFLTWLVTRLLFDEDDPQVLKLQQEDFEKEWSQMAHD